MKITYSELWKTYEGKGDIRDRARRSRYQRDTEKIVIPMQKGKISLKVEGNGARYKDYVAISPSRIYVVDDITIPYLYDLIAVLDENKDEVNENE
jgi:hypothetical protein